MYVEKNLHNMPHFHVLTTEHKVENFVRDCANAGRHIQFEYTKEEFNKDLSQLLYSDEVAKIVAKL